MCSAVTAMNCDIITAGGPGLMQASNEGARAGAVKPRGAEHLAFECTCRSSRM